MEEDWESGDEFEGLEEFEEDLEPQPSFMQYVRGRSAIAYVPENDKIVSALKRAACETAEARAARLRVSELSSKARMVYSQARDVLESEYDVSYDDDKCYSVGVADLAINTPIVFHAVCADPDLIVTVGHTGAVTGQRDDISNMSVWNGTKFVRVSGDGTFHVHAVSAKIDGHPLIPIRVMRGLKMDTYCWIFEESHYVLRRSSFLFEGRAELKNGVVYASVTDVEEVTIGGRKYPVVLSPVVAPTEIDQVLVMSGVSDGLILHSGVKEYKVKYHTTVDLIVRGGKACTSDGIIVMETSLPYGVYEFDLNTHAMIRGRPDRSTGNSSQTLARMSKASNVFLFLKHLRVTGVQICDSLEDHLLYTGEGVQTGILRAVRSRPCCWPETGLALELPLPLRLHLMGNEAKSVAYVKRVMVVQGYTVVNDRIIQMEELLPRCSADSEDDYCKQYAAHVCSTADHVMHDFVAGVLRGKDDYSYMPRKYQGPCGQALSLVVKSVRDGRK